MRAAKPFENKDVCSGSRALIHVRIVQLCTTERAFKHKGLRSRAYEELRESGKNRAFKPFITNDTIFAICTVLVWPLWTRAIKRTNSWACANGACPSTPGPSIRVGIEFYLGTSRGLASPTLSTSRLNII